MYDVYVVQGRSPFVATIIPVLQGLSADGPLGWITQNFKFISVELLSVDQDRAAAGWYAVAEWRGKFRRGGA